MSYPTMQVVDDVRLLLSCELDDAELRMLNRHVVHFIDSMIRLTHPGMVWYGMVCVWYGMCIYFTILRINWHNFFIYSHAHYQTSIALSEFTK